MRKLLDLTKFSLMEIPLILLIYIVKSQRRHHKRCIGFRRTGVRIRCFRRTDIRGLRLSRGGVNYNGITRLGIRRNHSTCLGVDEVAVFIYRGRLRRSSR